MDVLFLKLLCLLYIISRNSAIEFNRTRYASQEKFDRLEQQYFLNSGKRIDSPLYRSYIVNRYSSPQQPVRLRHSHHPHLDNFISKIMKYPTRDIQTAKIDKTETKESKDNDDEFEDYDIDNEEMETMEPDYDEWEESENVENGNSKNDELEESEEEEVKRSNNSRWQAEEAQDTQLSSFTQYKFKTLGSRSAVEQTRQSLLSNSENEDVNRTAVMQYVKKVLYESKCKDPYPKIVSVQEVHPDSRKIYTPRCIILHRCADDTGCCENHQTCGMKNQNTVELFFFTAFVGSRESRIEKLSFYNHTDCTCVDKINNTVKSRRNFIFDQNHNLRSSSVSVRSAVPQSSESLRRCKCPAEYKPRFQQHLSRCHCDCYEGNVDCLRMKRGKEHFSLKDRMCIQQSQCEIPACEYGAYQQLKGRCPKLHERKAVSTFSDTEN